MTKGDGLLTEATRHLFFVLTSHVRGISIYSSQNINARWYIFVMQVGLLNSNAVLAGGELSWTCVRHQPQPWEYGEGQQRSIKQKERLGENGESFKGYQVAS